VAAVTLTKQTKKQKKENTKAIELVSKSKYEQLERKYKRLERSQDKTIQRIEDLEDTIKLMRWQDTCKNIFIFHYMKLRYRPKLSEDQEKELYSEDGKHYYPLNGLTLEPVGFTRDRFTKELVKPSPFCSLELLPNPFGYMGYNKQMDNDRYWKLEEQAEKIAGRKCPMNFQTQRKTKSSIVLEGI
jgi:hypothetical protein